MLLNMVECIKINLLQKKKKKMFGLKKISVIIWVTKNN